VHEDVSKEEAAVQNCESTKNLYGDRHLTVRRRRQPKKQTQGNGGSQKKLAAARGRLTCRAVPARREGHGRQGPGKDSVVQGAQKRRTFGKRRRAEPECNSGIRVRDLKKRLRLGSMRAIKKALRQITGLEVAKRAEEFSIRLRKMTVRTLWKVGPFPNERRDCYTQSRSQRCRSSDHFRSFCLQ
jgi:hypothetical protein